MSSNSTGLVTASNDTDIVSLFGNELTKLPDHIQKESKSALSSAAIILKSCGDFKDKLKPLRTLQEYLTSKTTATKEVAQDLVAQLGTSVSASVKNEIVSAAQLPQVADESVQKYLEDSLRKTANKALLAGLGISVFGLTVEAMRLCEIWREICDAKEFSIMGFDEIKERLQRKIDRIPSQISQFAVGIEVTVFENMNDAQRLKFHVRKTREQNELRKFMDNLEKDIGDLEANVKGKIQKLRSFRDSATPAAVGQSVQGASLAVSLGMFGSSANGFLAVGTALAVVLHFVVAGSHIMLSENAGNTMRQLGRKLRNVEDLRDCVQEQKQKLDRVFLEFSDNIQDREDAAN